MWTIDAQCPRCVHRKTPQHIPEIECRDRAELIKTLSALTGTLNAPQYDGPGDGLIVVACSDFAVA